MVVLMSDLDPELKAMQSILDALEPLEPEARDRVIDYAFTRLGLTREGGGVPHVLSPPVPEKPQSGAQGPIDIRPTAMEMRQALAPQ